MKFTQAFSLATFLVSAAAGPTPNGHVLHEKREVEMPEWVKVARAEPHMEVPLRIGMTQRNLERGHDLLMEVSHPDSPKYGHYYSAEEINELFAPSDETVGAVKNWLQSSGVAAERIGHSVNKQWITLDCSVSELESLVKAKFHIYEHEVGDRHLATDEYHIPEYLKEHIDYITPGIRLMLGGKSPEKRKNQKRGLQKRNTFKLPVLTKPLPSGITGPKIQAASASGDLSLCSAIMSPACIKAMYNITDPTTATPGNELGIFESLGDHYTQSDLNMFFSAVSPNIPQGTHPEPRLIDGATGPTVVSAGAGPESNLDFQISYPIIYPQQSVLFQTDDDVYEDNYVFVGFLNNFLDAIDGSYCTYTAFGITGNSPGVDPSYPHKVPGGYRKKLQCGVYSPTNVISISYGGSESGTPINYYKRQCSEYMKLGMRGISVINSSGDAGVSAGQVGMANGCLLPGGALSDTKNGTIFSPNFPTSCPYITTLGSTFLPSGADPTSDQEVATTRFPSGGGFSNIFPRPSYQETAVNNFLTKYPPPYQSYSGTNNKKIGANGGIYNRAGRAYPDFAAVGDNVLIYNGSRPILIGGTSASSPCFAAILTRINEERLIAGKSTIGFVNPTLYAHPEVFHDITTGNNPGCGTNGFSAQPGWDPVTGYGTPSYDRMLRLYMGLSSGAGVHTGSIPKAK